MFRRILPFGSGWLILGAIGAAAVLTGARPVARKIGKGLKKLGEKIVDELDAYEAGLKEAEAPAEPSAAAEAEAKPESGTEPVAKPRAAQSAPKKMRPAPAARPRKSSPQRPVSKRTRRPSEG